MTEKKLTSQRRFSYYVWFVLGYNVLVILWGAFVRASGSGAGCGSHWPLCNGEVIPLAPTVARTIEFTHRGMSGLALLLVLGLIIWAFRVYPKGSLIRAGAVASGVLIIVEALIGAVIVLFGWVGIDQSTARVISVSLHLANTFLLLGALTLTGWWASGGGRLAWREHGNESRMVLLALLGVAFIGVTGALTALGDTLFPAASLAQGLEQDASSAASLLVRLRVIHPIAAVFVGTYILWLSVMMHGRPGSSTRRFAVILRLLVIAQLIAGMSNIILLAPTWLQLLHLLLADAIWITLVLFGASLLQAETTSTRASDPTTSQPAGAPAS